MAAAFAALVSLQNNLHLIQAHPSHSFSFDHKQIQSLSECVSFLIEFMESNDDSYGVRKEAGEALEMRIARAAEAAEDVIETHVVDQIRSGRTRSKTRSCRFLLDVQKVIGDMDYMRRKAINVKAQSGMETEQEQPTYSAAEATSSTLPTSNKTGMVGFDDILVLLLDKLTGLPSSRQVIPIVGMGGIGKTTLARNAFEHPLILQRFDVCLWAIISQKYSLTKILTELLSGMRNFAYKTVESTSGTADEAGVVLHKSLFGRRYLIILDDIWSVEAWDDIKFFFPDTNNGSRIVVTTRHSDVAYHFSNLWLEMSFLNEDSSWDLFCQKSFAEPICPRELEKIGKKIVEKCKGLPLAIVVVGGHLKKSSTTKEYWENVAHDMSSILNSTENEEHCLNVLSLSYSYLPVHLKPCFLLLGGFPEDQKIYVWDVVKLWITDGFIEASINKSLEEVAEDYLCDLYERNLILVDVFGYKGEIEDFKVHDLVRELCLKMAKKEEFLFVFDSPRAISRERRVVFSGKVAEVQQDHQTKTSDAPIRSLIYKGGWLPYDLKLLRTLNKVVKTSISESIFEQVNLRFLKVDLNHKCRPILYLPSSISLLWNLQILTIDLPAPSIVIAPYEIWEMFQLRHLEVTQICLFDPLHVDRLDDEANDLVLRNLLTLWDVENLRLSEEVCKRIPNIRELKLSYCDEASSDYCPHNLGYFHQLEDLVLQFDGNSKSLDFASSLTFPTSLKWLCLIGSRFDWEELTMMVGSLPNLISLQLYRHSVIGSVWTPVEGNFLGLKYLDIYGCDDLIYWNADSSNFPALEALRLTGLSKLDEFPSGIGEIPTLEWFQLEYCSESSTISAMRTLVEQEEQGNEDLGLYVCFQGDEETLESFNKKVREEGLTSKNLVLHLPNAMHTRL